MTSTPETRYARGADGDIAYQVVGKGDRTILFIQNWSSNIEAMWEEPTARRYFDRLGSLGRVIVFDKRGSGISDPVPLDRLPTLEQWMDDARLVLDAAGADEAVLIGDTEGGPMAMLLAAAHPERASALVLVNSFARFLRAPDYRIGVPVSVEESLVEGWRRDWGAGGMLTITAPSVANDPHWRAWLARYQRLAMSPRQAMASYRWVLRTDVRAILGSIQAPTLVVHRRGNRYYRLAYGRYLANEIPDARLVTVPGADVYPFHVNAEPVLGEIETFLTGVRAVAPTTRVLATVLFIDIVDSTGHATRLGDGPWQRLLDRYRRMVRDQLALQGGVERDVTGDGFMATFDGPGRALRCAAAIAAAVRELGLEVRAGLHTGEIEVDGPDVAGIAVHIAARVVTAAEPSTVWTTGTVRDLVIGSGIEFADRGEHRLKGVPGTWRLHEVVGTAP